MGIGRELYSAPFTFLKVETEADGTDNRGRPKYKLKDQFVRYEVGEIGYDGRKINRLTIINPKDGSCVYEYGARAQSKPKNAPKSNAKPSNATAPSNATMEKVDKVPSVDNSFNPEAAFKAFLAQHKLTPTTFTAWRDKAASDASTGVQQIPFKEMTSEQWQSLLLKLGELHASGYPFPTEEE